LPKLAGTEHEQDVERDIRRELDGSESLESMWRVLIHNDDVTPYDFVVAILIRVFDLTPIIAEHITYLAHTKGIALVTVLAKTEAERRVGKAHFAARLEGFPLTFTLEPED
jgi:ATP-dependent Clp protease adaptor protein ClpS